MLLTIYRLSFSILYNVSPYFLQMHLTVKSVSAFGTKKVQTLHNTVA